ncbi:transposase IS4 family protein [Bacillus cytotoxicus NVH 391-98]|uniref:Transposase IS4 family protein n=1 Tax=Bacillus cytotoxicus (strain DSM 22905 / CIP 110041 / 391-98 / NVH 391-98) TaxID=315749 RepID=A7GMF1_BACCN|nr:transposase IS4 family protein [Bacillus cytotoxicus NVH 391-98]
MEKITRKTSFKQWLSPISTSLFEEQVKKHHLNHYTKKLHMASFMKLLLYAQLHETESLLALSACIFSEELQNTTEKASMSGMSSNKIRSEASFTACLYGKRVFVDDKECMYVFDSGYLDYERFDHMTDKGYFFVSRLRKNAVTQVIEKFSFPKKAAVISDEMIVIGIGTTQNRSENAFRFIKVLDSKGNELHLLTNRFDLGADEIAELHKSRWAIELFFKWMKQHLNIKKFYGQNEQAVHNQIYIAMIVYCLHVLAQLSSQSKRTYLQISRFLKASLWNPAHIWQRKIQGKSVP